MGEIEKICSSVMIKKIVMVIGAGASKEVGLPIGQELTSRIASLLSIKFDGWEMVSGDGLIVEGIRLLAQNENNNIKKNDYFEAARIIHNAMPQALSIDSFIDAHNGNKAIELCGKLAIVRSILQAEQASNLYFGLNDRAGIDFNKVNATWFNSFMKILTESCRINDLKERLESLVMVIFNYDRCVEHFIFNSLQNYYSMESKQAAELVSHITIYHPYGKVGHLPWQQKDGAIAFGEDPTLHQLINLSKQIRTFTEGIDPKVSEIDKIREQISSSGVLLFLGFAFHKLNMQLLSSSEEIKPKGSNRQCFATAKNISKHNCEIIRRELIKWQLLEKNIHIGNELGCYELFQEYWRSLSFA